MEFVCCRKCERRFPGCHESCEEYLATKGTHEKKKEVLMKIRAREMESRAYINNHYDRTRR